jgi:outer membrane receptor for ferrienterochelin and colicin
MKSILYVVVTIFLTIVVFAQEKKDQNGAIRGEIYNGTTNEPIIGANVVVVGYSLGAVSDDLGLYSIPVIPTGTYSLRVSAIGYTPYIATDIVVVTSKPTEIRISLQESMLEVDGVQVTASYFQKIPDRPLSNLLQTNEEIRRLPGGLEDVVRAISILPGVAQVQPGRNDLIVRGGAPSENLFIIDNLEVPNINHFGTQGASGGPLSYVNLDFVERTSFSTGGFGVMHGDKISSVLDIDLREGRKDRIGGKATISASQFGLNMEGPIYEDGNFIFSARRSYLDFIFKAAGFGFVPEYWDFLGKVHYHLSPTDQLVVLGVGALDNVKLFNDTPDKRFKNSRILGSDQNQFVGGVTWRHLMSHGFTTLTFGQTYVDYNYKQSDSLLNPIFKNSSYEYESSLRGDLVTRIFENTELSTGVQLKIVRFLSDINLKQQITSFGNTINMQGVYKTMAAKAAIYAQVSQDIGLLRFTAGGRMDYFDLIENKFIISPRTSATYAITQVMNVNVSIGRYYQAPSYIWLAAYQANRKLSFIGTDQYVIGVDNLFREDIKLSIEGYYKNYFDYPASLTRTYLVLANTGAGFGGSEEGFASFGLDPLVNKGSGYARGIEMLMQKKLSEIPYYGTVSISYNESRFTALDGIERPSSYDQRWILNAGGGYIFNEKWEVSAKFRYATGRPYTPFGSGASQLAVQYNSLRIDANHSLDIRIDRRWSFATWTLDTYIDIQNIYNRKPVDVPRFNPRTGQAEQESSIGILPSIGVSAEF